MKIRSNEEEFIVSLENEEKVFISFKKQLIPLEYVNGSVIVPFKTIYELTQGLPSILRFVNEDNIPLFEFPKESEEMDDTLESTRVEALDFVDIEEDTKLCHLYKDTVISLYLSKDNFLRVLVGELPLSNRFIDHSELISAKQLDSEKVEVIIDVTTIFSHVSESDLSLTFRGTLERLTVPFSSLEKRESDTAGLFVTRITYIINQEEIKKVHEIDGYSNYFNNILDLSIDFHLNSNYLVRRRHRVSLESDYQTYLLMEHEDYLSGLKFYPTMNQKSSIILETIPTESGACLDIKATSKQDGQKPVVLFCEYPEKAQDTGFSQFSYMADNYQDEFDCYYIIDKESPDMINLEKYMDKVLFYKSPKHFEYFMKADILFHSHSAMYASPVKKQTFQDKQDSIFKVFLQHGVLGVRDLSSMYAKGDRSFTNLFICSSDREQHIIENDYGYEKDEIALTGLSRFDNLFLKYQAFSESRTGEVRTLLIFPSWRKGQNRLSDEKFMETNFYNEFQSLINDDEFINLLKKNNITAKFLLHPNFNHYSHLFTSDYIETNIKHYILQNELVENDFLLTDFSSAALDFALLKKIVIYYQFDRKLVETKKDNNLKRFLPGKIIYKRKRLLKYLQKSFDHNTISKKYAKRLSNLYKFEDTNARDRIIEYTLKSMHKKNA